MTSFQKVIKYVAFALAISLVFTIFGGIITGLSSISFLFSEKETEILEEMQTYTVDGEISSLSIDLSGARFKIQTADKFSVESNHKYIFVKEDNGELKIGETKEVFSVANEGVSVILNIPKDVVFEETNIDVDAGLIEVDALLCNVLEFSIDAGKAEINNLVANTRAKINGGSGELDIKDGKLCNLSLDMGVGKLTLKSRIEGKSELDYGVGETNLILIGSEADYKIELDQGIGDAKISGERMNGDLSYGAGENFIEIDGGVGALNIDFAA